MQKEDQAPLTLEYNGGYYLTDGTRRTRCYITPEACHVAVERGQFYTAKEYKALLNVKSKRSNGIRRLNAVIKIEKA